MLLSLDGDGAAYRQLLTALGDRLRAYFSVRMRSEPGEVEDIVQETLLAVHTRRETYDRSRPLTVWVHAIARYKLIDHWRRGRSRQHVPLDDYADFLAAHQSDPDDGLDLTRALNALPGKQSDLIKDVKITGLSMAEAGERAGMTEGAAKVGLHRALKALARKVRGDAD